MGIRYLCIHRHSSRYSDTMIYYYYPINHFTYMQARLVYYRLRVKTKLKMHDVGLYMLHHGIDRYPQWGNSHKYSGEIN